MTRNTSSQNGPRSWRRFARRDGAVVERELREGRQPHCPGCGELLEAEPSSRVAAQLVLDARAFDLTCRPCRRFWSFIQHTARSLRLMRMRRLAAAVRAIETPAGTASVSLSASAPPGA